ncbi:MAG: shikimate dehydrogenase [Candidatus Binatia bacterium]
MTLLSISGQTRIVGIFGDPIAHTRSPAMQNAAFRALQLPFVYVPFLVRPPELSRAVQSIRTLNLAGVNVTVPHKERVVRHLDRLSEEAQQCGAVNTIVNHAGILLGDNTDGRGFIQSLKERNISPQQGPVIMIGAGGSARAVLVSLIQAGYSHISIVNRTIKNAQTLVRAYRQLSHAHMDALPLEALRDPTLLKEATLIINCTPLGLYGEKFPTLAYKETPQNCVFYDLLYRPDLTSFLQGAQRSRRPILDGRRMLLHQGALAFLLWTNTSAPLSVMARALNQSLKQQG